MINVTEICRKKARAARRQRAALVADGEDAALVADGEDARESVRAMVMAAFGTAKGFPAP